MSGDPLISEVNTIIAMNRLVGDIYCLLKFLNKLGIDTSYATMDGMDSLAYQRYLKGHQNGSGLQ